MPAPVTSNIFKRMLSPAQLERAALDILQEWMPDYLAEFERQQGWDAGTLPIPTNYDNRNSFDAQAGEPIPKVIAISPGLRGRPLMSGNGSYRAIWELGIGVAMAHKDEPTANDLTKAYGTVVRKILTDKQSLGNFPGVIEITWDGETYEDLPIESQIMLYKAAGIYFLVDVENVTTARSGPANHNDTTYGIAETVDVTLIKVPVDESV